MILDSTTLIKGCLFLLLLFPSIANSNTLNLCSREGSIEVQQLIEKHVLPVVEYYEYELPDSCPLKIENSRFYLENRYKERLDNGHFRCGLCDKEFVHEYYLLLHHERKHPELQNPSTVCLDKYRDMFDGISGNRAVDCRSSEIQRSLVQCQKTVLRCFPMNESDFESELYKYMYRTLCAPMRCKGGGGQEKVDDYKPVTMTVVVLPIVIIIVVFVIIIIFMYKKFSSPKDDLQVFSKLD